MIYLTLEQKLFLIIAPVVLLIILFLLLFFPIKKRVLKNKYKELCYKKLYDLVENEDYYLINNFNFNIGNSRVAHIDHIVFGDKYIYVINSHYYNGDIMGKVDDPSLIVIPKKGDKYYSENPIITNKFLASRLSVVTSLEPSYLVGINVVNDECRISIDSQSAQFFIIQRSKVCELIKNIESRPIGKLDPQALDTAVQEIYKMNIKEEDGKPVTKSSN